jgi:parallel beta-helix repeat protein
MFLHSNKLFLKKSGFARKIYKLNSIVIILEPIFGDNMKKTNKKGLSIGIFLILLSLGLISNSYVTFSQQNDSITQITIEDLIEIPEIMISHDDNFTDYTTSGVGTPEDPYVIENYNITSGGPWGILINGTASGQINVNFIIRNCWITAIDVCILIIDAQPNLVTIDNCTCVNTIAGDGIGIHLIRCNGATVINCNCNYNFYTGIRVDTSSALWIENNTCYQNGDEGLYVDNGSDNGMFKRNNLIDNGWHGIANQVSNSNTYVYNNISNNGNIGFEIVSSLSLIIENNSICENGMQGIYLASSDYALIRFNKIEGNGDYGVDIVNNTDECVIHHNNFIGNNVGGTSQAIEDYIAGHRDCEWYDSAINEGNYWSDYVSPGVYDIDGTASNYDPYPLDSPVDLELISEYASSILSIILLISFIGTISFVIRKK